MNIENLKSWVDICELLGFTSLMLYTEDTVKLENRPYFGYMRGRYSKEEMKDILKNDLIGFVIGFVFLALVSFVTKGSLGFGDVKLFGIIGITAGSFGTYSTLLISLIASLIVSLVFITIKKMDRKSAFPFGPCIALGYIVSILLTSY